MRREAIGKATWRRRGRGEGARLIALGRRNDKAQIRWDGARVSVVSWKAVGVSSETERERETEREKIGIREKMHIHIQ